VVTRVVEFGVCMRVFLWFVLVFTGACSGTNHVCNKAGRQAASVVLGTGADHFIAFEDEEVLRPVWGAQGGHHIWGSVQTTGLNPGFGDPPDERDGEGLRAGKPPFGDWVKLRFGFSYPDDVKDADEVTFESIMDGDEKLAESFGHTVFISPYRIFAKYPDQDAVRIEMSVQAEDVCGTVVSDQRAFIMEWTAELEAGLEEE